MSCSRRRRWKRRSATSSPTRRWSTSNGNAIGGNGPPTFGLGWDPNPKLNQFHLVAGHPPETDDQIVIDKQTADKGDFHVGDQVTVLTTKAPKKYQLVGIAKFGTVDSLAGASIVIFTPRRGAARREREERVLADLGRRQAGCLADPGRRRTSSRRWPRTASSYQVITGQGAHEGEPGHRSTRRSASSAPRCWCSRSSRSSSGCSSSTTRSRSSSRNACGRWRSSARSARRRRQVLGSVIGESVVVGILASAVGVAAGVGLSIGLKAVMNAVGFQIPGSGVVLRPIAVIVGIARRGRS